MSYDLERVYLARKVSIHAIIKNLVLLAAMILVCIITKSLAILTDIVFTCANILASFVLINGFKSSLKPADNKCHYGYGKAEAITAVILAAALIPISFYLGYKALNALFLGVSHEGGSGDIYAIVVLLITAIVKEYSYVHTKKVAKEIRSTAMMTKAWYHRNCALSSATALLGIIGNYLGLHYLDPLAATLVSLFIFVMAVVLYKDALLELMDTAPEAEIIKQIEDAASSVEGIGKICGIKARKHGGCIMVDMSLALDSKMTIEEGISIMDKVKASITKQVKCVKDITIEISPFTGKEKVSLTENSGHIAM